MKLFSMDPFHCACNVQREGCVACKLLYLGNLGKDLNGGHGIPIQSTLHCRKPKSIPRHQWWELTLIVLHIKSRTSWNMEFLFNQRDQSGAFLKLFGFPQKYPSSQIWRIWIQGGNSNVEHWHLHCGLLAIYAGKLAKPCYNFCEKVLNITTRESVTVKPPSKMQIQSLRGGNW